MPVNDPSNAPRGSLYNRYRPMRFDELVGQEHVARALGKLHGDEKLWQDPRGRLCVRGSAFAAKPPVKAS